MRIAEAASQSGLSIDTIRYYEKSGLLPEIPRAADGRRSFSAEAIDWLVLLGHLRSTGMPMKTMREFAALYRRGSDTIDDRRKILVTHAESLKQRRADLDRCERLLRHKLALYDQYECR